MTLLTGLVVAPLLAGCAGGQTGDEGETHELCDLRLTPVAADDASRLGFSPSQVLALAEGERTADFEWLPSPQFPYGPESGPSSAALGITGLGDAKLAEVVTPWPCCADELKVRVRVSLTTAGGALDESFDAELVARRAESASLTFLLDAERLGGSLAFDPAALGRAKVERLQLDVRFQRTSLDGSLQAHVVESDGSGPNSTSSLTAIHLARWGEASAVQLCGD
jgi:hypothetical protein